MFGNQIVKNITGHKTWKSEAYKAQTNSIKSTIENSPQFYIGKYKDIENEVKKRVSGKLFMGNLGISIKLPYRKFTLCFHGNNDTTKHALVIEQLNMECPGIAINYLVSIKSEKWFLLPFAKIYLFNKTFGQLLEELKTDLKQLSRKIKITGDLSNSNSAILYHKKRSLFEFKNDTKDIQKTLGAVLNYFLVLYNQRYIVTETIHQEKPGSKRKKKNRLFDYKVLSVKLPRGGKRYRYDSNDNKSKGIVPFTWVAGIWKTYTEEAPMFGNPNLFGDFWIPSYVRGSKQAGFISKDYSVKV